MKPTSHPSGVRSFTGNIEERAVKIERIKERLDRLSGNAHQQAAELSVLAREIKTLHDAEAAPAADVHSRQQHN